jgi:hypothetical protein
MSALDVRSTADIVTIKSPDGEWQALIIDESTVIEQTGNWVDNKEAALEDLLDMLSHDLLNEYLGQLV